MAAFRVLKDLIEHKGLKNQSILGNFDNRVRLEKRKEFWAGVHSLSNFLKHADNDPEFQSFALARMEPYLETEGIKKSNYAYLWDRVAVNTDRKQRYGTQPIWWRAHTWRLSSFAQDWMPSTCRAIYGLA